MMKTHALLRIAGLVLILLTTASSSGAAAGPKCVGWGEGCKRCIEEDCAHCGGADCVALACEGKPFEFECPPGG